MRLGNGSRPNDPDPDLRNGCHRSSSDPSLAGHSTICTQHVYQHTLHVSMCFARLAQAYTRRFDGNLATTEVYRLYCYAERQNALPRRSEWQR